MGRSPKIGHYQIVDEPRYTFNTLSILLDLTRNKTKVHILIFNQSNMYFWRFYIYVNLTTYVKEQ